jgi:tetratricopeptide (TPR) repeat protein
LVAGVLLVVIGSVSILYQIANHYASAYTFNQATVALQQGDLPKANNLLQTAYRLQPNHEYARQRARSAIAELNQLLSLEEPTNTEQKKFQEVLANGIAAAQQAVLGNPHDSRNWAIQAAVYNTIIDNDIPEARTRGLAAISEAKRLNPTNPELYALEAQLLFRSGNTEAARDAIMQALALKSNYVPALNLLTELEIVADNLKEARASVQSIIRLEPNNPGRYYQLAILLLADNEQNQAVQALERAIALDNDFANARYVLGLQYSDLGRIDDAIAQLEYVRVLNPNNESVGDLIQQLRDNGALDNATVPDTEVSESAPQTTNGSVQGDSKPDTELLSPVNASSDTPPQDTPNTTPTISSPEDTSSTETE